MTNYTDSKQRSWNLFINVTALKNVRRKVKDAEGKSVDLMDCLNSSLTIRLLNDPVLLVDTLSVLCAEQISALKISAEDFAEAHTGDVVQNALDALMEAFENFCRKPDRENLRQRYAMAQRLREASVKMMLETEQNTEKTLKAQTPEQIQAKMEEATQMATFQEVQKHQPNAGD